MLEQDNGATVDRSRIYRVFDEALGLEGAERERHLLAQCAGDEAALAEIRELLAIAASNDAATASFLRPASQVSRDALLGREFGRFRLLEVIGAGGMGVVYRAERTDGVQQAVAVKLLAGEITGSDYARFEREARMLARLEHPAVARLIDTGVQDGRGWIALEFIRGEPIDSYCDAHALSVRSRVALLVQVADAVAAAHRMLVVHRDIKPANVLVSSDGLPKLIDFGIAASLTAPTAAHQATADVGRLFTPHYAAPEQVSGDPVTVATDVFGLGALGYRLLTGHAPHAEADGAVRYLLAVTRQEVATPSREALRSGLDVRIARSLRGDLDAILRKALARDPARRYATAADLRADLQRHLDRLPVEARAPSLGYVAGRFIRRHAIPVIAATVLSLGLIAAVVVYEVQARSVAVAHEMAARRGQFLERIIKSADPRGGRRDITVAEILDGAAKQSDTELAKEPEVAASLLGVLASTNAGLGRFPEALALTEREVALLRSHGGSPDDLAAALTQRGDLLNTNGRIQEAEAPLREALSLLKSQCRGNGFGVTSDVLGVVLANTAREPEAETAYRRSIECYRHLGAAAAGKAADPLNNLQVLLGNEGRYEEALAAGREAVALMRARVPADHPDFLGMEMNLAGTLASLHRAVEAEPIFRDVVAQRTRVLGPDHLDTLNARTQLADDLYEQHRDAEAATLEHPTAQTLERVAGPTHPWTLYAWALYGITACRSGQADGLDALRHVSTARIQLYGANDWHTLSTDVSIGICLVQMKQYSAAEPGLLRAAHGLEADRGPGFLRTQAAFQALHDLYAGLGNADEAARWAAKIQPASP